MTLKKEISESQQISKNEISVKDIKTWGLEVLRKEISDSATYYAVELPDKAEIKDNKGNVIAQASGKNNIALYNIDTGKVSVGKKQDLSKFYPHLLPTLAQVQEWEQREKNLSKEDKIMFARIVEKQARTLTLQVHKVYHTKDNGDRVIEIASIPSGYPNEELIRIRKKALHKELIKDKGLFERLKKSLIEEDKKHIISKRSTTILPPRGLLGKNRKCR